MTVLDIVKEYLERNGYDGIHYEDICACLCDDLAPCEKRDEGGMMHCVPGYRTNCPPECGDHDWHISEKRDGA